MKKVVKKLELKKATVAALNNSELSKVAAAGCITATGHWCCW